MYVSGELLGYRASMRAAVTLRETPLKEIAAQLRIGIVFQRFNLFPGGPGKA